MTGPVAALNDNIEAINDRWTKAVLSDGSVVPIINWFDDEGEDTTDRDDAVVFVCGDDVAGWWIGTFDAFEPARQH